MRRTGASSWSTAADRLAMSLRRPIAVACLLGIAAAPAWAQSQNDRLDMLESRMGSVERQLENQGLIEMSRQIESLTEELRKLRGEFEQVQHELERSRAQQRDQYVDLDTRLRAAETALDRRPVGRGPRRAGSRVPGGLQPAEGRQVRRGGDGAPRVHRPESAARARAERHVLARRGPLCAPRLPRGAGSVRGPAHATIRTRARRRTPS